MATPNSQLELLTHTERAAATHTAWMVFAGYMQSREAKDATKRYRLWRRGEKEVRVRLAGACARGEISARVALLMLNDTMY